MNLDAAFTTFVAESTELLQQMEDALLQFDHLSCDAEAVNAIFRAAHTIKGSAGLFGLDEIVSFTHTAESVLDRVRAGEVTLAPELAAVLLKVCDHIGKLVDLAGSGSAADDATRRVGAELTQRLSGYLGGHNEAMPAPALPDEPQVKREGGGLVETDHWHLSLRFGPDVLRNGMDPLSFIRYLGTIGEIVSVVTLTDAMPRAAEMDPETSYFGYEIGFRSEADKATIESVFDFVRDDSRIRVLPPHSCHDEYLALIREMSGDDLRLGEILVRCGTLTPAELEQALFSQEQSTKHPPPPIGEVLVEQNMVRPNVVEAALDKQRQAKDGKAGTNLIRVDAHKLDQLINQIGELIIAGAGAAIVARAAGSAELLEATSTMSRLVEQVRDSALKLRMVQIGSTFNRFQRVVHDVSKELGKDIALVISGAETELDKTVVEHIGDPLMHLVRNAMDHGIETAEVRAARGKPARGTLHLNAFHDSGSIVIEVSDDGGGLNRDRILKKAVARGLVGEGAPLTDKEIWNLIFEPGFSTADQISNLSGRGVGMDVVRRNINALRGSVDIDTEEGIGTTVRIRLPLTLAIIDGFHVAVGNASFVLPLDLVVECLEMSAEDRKAANERNYISLRGQVLPYLNLRAMFSVEGDPARRENLVVVQHGGTRVGLVVDYLLGEIQTVIKPLGKLFDQVNGIAGSTILGNGHVALILDVPALIRQSCSVEEKQIAGARAIVSEALEH
jgi:two-component system, chemotaxis family, sensor kinase CheA